MEKKNGKYTARRSGRLNMYIAVCVMPDGPMGWDPYTAYFGISKEVFDRFDEPGFDPWPHMKFLFCDKPEQNCTPGAQAYYRKYHGK